MSESPSRGDIWLNLKDNTMNFRRNSPYVESKDFYGKYATPDAINIIE